eukprot:Awhi_evm1s9096
MNEKDITIIVSESPPVDKTSIAYVTSDFQSKVAFGRTNFDSLAISTDMTTFATATAKTILDNLIADDR